MKQLVIFPKGSLSQKDKERMSKEGYCAVEADDPSKVIVPLPAGAVTGDMLSLCALDAMAGPRSSEERSRFTENLTRRLKAREATPASAS